MFVLNEYVTEKVHMEQLKEIERQSDALELVRLARPPRPGVGSHVICQFLRAIGDQLVLLGQHLKANRSDYPAHLNEALVGRIGKSL